MLSDAVHFATYYGQPIAVVIAVASVTNCCPWAGVSFLCAGGCVWALTSLMKAVRSAHAVTTPPLLNAAIAFFSLSRNQLSV